MRRGGSRRSGDEEGAPATSGEEEGGEMEVCEFENQVVDLVV